MKKIKDFIRFGIPVFPLRPLGFEGQVAGMTMVLMTVVAVIIPNQAAAFDYEFDNSKVALSGYGTLGNLSRTDKRPHALAFDWQARGQYSQDGGGAVLTFNQLSETKSYYLQDLFAFFDVWSGRIEIGHTNSAGQKLSVGLPDAGGLRLNNSFMIFGMLAHPNTIATPSVNSSSHKIRASYVSKPGEFQAGAGVATPWFDMDGSVDAGLRFKGGTAVKYSVSLGASHIFNPDKLVAEIYAPKVSADSRTESALGLNIQYNSWSFGTVGKIIYDHDPEGTASDGIMYGAGASYEILSWRTSLNAVRSDTGVFHDCAGECRNTVVLFSVQDKLDDIVDIWASVGKIFGEEDPFFWSVNLRAKF